MSYYSNDYDNSECFESYNFGMQRNTSSSVYYSRQNAFEESNEFYGSFRSSNTDEENNSSSPRPKSANHFGLEKQNQKEEQEQSVPGSTDADSEDSFESHFEAIDELSELFGNDSSSQPTAGRGSIFSRPSNPVVKDTQFCIPRCSAPAPAAPRGNLEVTEMNFSCPASSMKRELDLGNSYTTPSGSVFRPVAKINNPLTFAPASF